MTRRPDVSSSFIALEAGRARRIAHREPDFAGAIAGRELRMLLAARALLVHRHVEAGFIDRHLARAQHVLRQVEREAEGVVELERHIARQHAALAERRGRFIQQRKAAAERALEALLFLLEGDFRSRPARGSSSG